jgi:hypothetical protein
MEQQHQQLVTDHHATASELASELEPFLSQPNQFIPTE